MNTLTGVTEGTKLKLEKELASIYRDECVQSSLVNRSGVETDPLMKELKKDISDAVTLMEPSKWGIKDKYGNLDKDTGGGNMWIAALGKSPGTWLAWFADV